MVDVHTLKILSQPLRSAASCVDGLITSPDLTVFDALEKAQCQLEIALNVMANIGSEVPAEQASLHFAAATCAAIAKALLDSVVEAVVFPAQGEEHA